MSRHLKIPVEYNNWQNIVGKYDDIFLKFFLLSKDFVNEFDHNFLPSFQRHIRRQYIEADC